MAGVRIEGVQGMDEAVVEEYGVVRQEMVVEYPRTEGGIGLTRLPPFIK